MAWQRALLHRVAAGLGISALCVAGAGCHSPDGEKCWRTGIAISAHAPVITFRVPPGGAKPVLEVSGINFAPNAAMTLSFSGYPTKPMADFTEFAATRWDGSLAWSKELSQLPALDVKADPNVDVQITASEQGTGCRGITFLKTAEIIDLK